MTVEDFFKFVNERHNIFLRRFDGLNDIGLIPGEYTFDKSISRFHYTNVYRELDRGTVFYIKFIADKNAAPLDAGIFGQYGYLKLFSTLMYRLFNKMETYSAITQDLIAEGNGWNKEGVMKTIKKMQDAGMPVFTNAFMVTGSDHPEVHDKAEKKVLDLDEIWMDFENIWKKIKYATSLKRAWEVIAELPGFGPFLAYEVVCDLMYAKILPFAENDWVNVGPGCAKGIAEIYPKLERGEYEKTITFLCNEQDTYLIPLGFRYLNKKRLSLRNIEHSLCEYSKYCRARHGERMKRKWHGPTPDDGWYRRALYELYGIGSEPKALIVQNTLLPELS